MVKLTNKLIQVLRNFVYLPFEITGYLTTEADTVTLLTVEAGTADSNNLLAKKEYPYFYHTHILDEGDQSDDLPSEIDIIGIMVHASQFSNYFRTQLIITPYGIYFQRVVKKMKQSNLSYMDYFKNVFDYLIAAREIDLSTFLN